MNRRATAGYTIVEVIIVLAVTGGLLLSTILLLGGKQAQTQSSESVRSFDSSLEAMSRDVASGFYTFDNSCSAAPAGPVTLGVGGTAGSNTGCIFIGKLLNIQTAGDDSSGIFINLVGRQFVNNTVSDDVSTLSEAQPVKITSNVIDYTFPFALKVTKMVDSSGTTEYRALAFIVELGGGSSSANPVTGSRGIQLYGVLGSVVGNSTGITLDVSGTNLKPLTDGLIICMKTINNKYAQINIGSGGNQYTTNVLIDSGVENVCKMP